MDFGEGDGEDEHVRGMLPAGFGGRVAGWETATGGFGVCCVSALETKSRIAKLGIDMTEKRNSLA